MSEDKKDESDLITLLSVNAEKKAGLTIAQFMLFMQQEKIWPCHQFIGGAPQPITPDEAMKLKRKYVELLRRS